MADKDSKGEDEPRQVPEQIPLLVDVVDNPLPQPRRTRRKKRENYALDLEPDPPKTQDLFERERFREDLLDLSLNDDPPPDDLEPARGADENTPGADADKALDDLETLDSFEDLGDLDDIEELPDLDDMEDLGDLSELDDLQEAILGDSTEAQDEDEPEIDFAARMSAQFRFQADNLVDNLVKEYSREIVSRLREELTSLLQELEDDRTEGKGPGDPE